MLVSDIMNKEIVSVSPEESVALASRLLSRHNIGSLPVCGGDGKLRGIITDRDIVLRCVAVDEDPDIMPVSEIMSRSVITISPQDDINRASELMSIGQVRRLPVTEDGKLVGMLALGDMARSYTCDMEAARALSEISSNLRHR
ncbi:MAG: CBS domain-containing protein [Oscillospiraceae bacterium]